MSSKFKATENQQKAIDGKGSLLVSAAAGSGKTATLVDRVIKKLTDPEDMYKITDLLMVTFTKAAASEMRSRISAALNEKLSQDISPVLKRHLREQAVLLPKADICTVDSFCKNIISDNFDVLSLPPDFKIIPDPQLAIMKEQALTDTVEYFLSVKKTEFSSLMKLLATDSRLENIRSVISLIHDYMLTLPFPEEWKEDCISMYRGFSSAENSEWGKYMLSSLYARFNSTADLIESALNDISRDDVLRAKRSGDLETCRDYCLKMCGKLKEGSFAEIADFAAAGKPVRWSEKLYSKKENFDPSLAEKAEQVRAKFAKTLEKARKVLIFSQKDCAKEARRLTPYIELLFEAADRYSDLLAAQKREKNYLDFADLEHLTLKLLAVRENRKTTLTPFAKTVSDRFREVLVDEYQDTNDLQDEIFRIISDDRKKLFCVGDVKQSIYGFRRSNPKNFLSLLDSYDTFDGKSCRSKIILSENFRSRKGVCGAVNFIFSKVMSKECGDIDYNEEHALNAAAKFPERDMNDVQIDIIDLDEQDERTILQTEADRVAEIIKDMLEKECISRKGKLEKPNFGDFCVLMRTVKDTAKPFADRLSEHGIPCSYSHSEDFFSIPEVSKMMSVLKVINNPLDDIALLSAMMCPIFGFTANETAEIRAKNRKCNMYSALRLSAESGNKKARDFLGLVSLLRKYSATHTVDRLIAKIYDDTGLPEIYLTEDGGSLKRQNLLRLRDIALDRVNEGYDTNFEFLRFAEKVQKGEIKLSADPSDGEGGGVRIMSIHHSKGLQFPVVFLAGLTKKKNTDTSAFQLDQKYGVGLKIYDPSTRKKSSTLMFEAVKSAKAKSESSELLRIYYVAATRAIDNLFIIACEKNAESALKNASAALGSDYGGKNRPIDPIIVEDAPSFSSLVYCCALLHPDGKQLRSELGANFSPDDAESPITVNHLHSSDVEKSVEKETETAVLSEEVDEEYLEKLKGDMKYEYDFKALSALCAKISVSGLTHKSKLSESFAMRPAFLQNEALSAAEKGTAMHSFMQYSDYISAKNDLENEIFVLKEQRFLSPVQADSLDRKKLAAFFESELFARMENSEKLLREQRFIMEIPARRLDPTLPEKVANEPIAVQGIADCIFFENGQPIIVDYKTDLVSDEQVLRERYSAQLDIYAEAFEKILGQKVRQKLIYSFALSKTIEL